MGEKSSCEPSIRALLNFQRPGGGKDFWKFLSRLVSPKYDRFVFNFFSLNLYRKVVSHQRISFIYILARHSCFFFFFFLIRTQLDSFIWKLIDRVILGFANCHQPRTTDTHALFQSSSYPMIVIRFFEYGFPRIPYDYSSNSFFSFSFPLFPFPTHANSKLWESTIRLCLFCTMHHYPNFRLIPFYARSEFYSLFC